MPFSHFGNYADVWKHLALCHILALEQVPVYVESNAASASYKLDGSPGQLYGICHFLAQAAAVPPLCRSHYYQLEKRAAEQGRYTGSPGLAMQLLNKTASRFLFFDIEAAALDNIRRYAAGLKLDALTELRREDSRGGLMKVLPDLPGEAFVLIDPYYIDQPGPEGFDYLDVFAACVRRGLRTLLWYGFHSLSEKEGLRQLFHHRLKGSGPINGAELILAEMGREGSPVNPGIPANGLLWANMPGTVTRDLLAFSGLLADIYRDARFEGHRGALHREVVRIV